MGDETMRRKAGEDTVPWEAFDETHPDYAPSPARDDAEKAIAGLLAEHRHWYQDIGPVHYICYCDTPQTAFLDREGHEAHVASVIAAHMAAPDELTALRERIRALADEWESQPDLQQKADAKSLRALLGDV